MKTTRLTLLRQWLADEPADPFNHYALALELRATNPAEAVRVFEQLLVNHPDYLATYYQAAQLLADLGLTDRAFQVYEQGIMLATQQKNERTRQELLRAKQALVDDFLTD